MDTLGIDLWPWHPRGLEETRMAIAEGHKAIVYACPTGMGKTSAIAYMAKSAALKNKRVTAFTNRKIITGQAAKVFAKEGIEHGTIAAGSPLDLLKPLQLARIQTINSRVFEQEKFILPPSDLVLIDEGHSRAYDRIIEQYKQQGAICVCFTATPVNFPKDLYTKLVIAGTKAEGRAQKALVSCDTFAPFEPDMKGVKRNKIGEYSQNGMAKRVMQTIVFADVFKEWNRCNPWARPTIVFAPGVPESRWFCEQFNTMGVKAAHVDAKTEENEREDIFGGIMDGRIKLVSSFGVLREGFDCKALEVGILLQVCGALSTYLQCVGRLLRACLETGKASATLLDFAGAWWRHGSPNYDPDWTLGVTDKKLAADRKKKLSSQREPEPICCPNCQGLRSQGPKCPHCGHEHKKSCRVVVMNDGELSKMHGNIYERKETDDQRVWTSCLYQAAYSGRTLTQARGMFFKKLERWPSGVTPMPEKGSPDWHRGAVQVYPWLGRRKKGA